MNINNVFELAEVIYELKRDDYSQRGIVELMSQKLFKYTSRGLRLVPLDMNGECIDFDNTYNDMICGIGITGIVEGTEIEGFKSLIFPFKVQAFWNAADDLSQELADAEAEWMMNAQKKNEPTFEILAALKNLYEKYVVDMHGEKTCDCDKSVGITTCAPCEARAIFLKYNMKFTGYEKYSED